MSLLVMEQVALAVCIERPRRGPFQGLLPDDLRIDVAASIDAKAQFNLPPHQSELN